MFFSCWQNGLLDVVMSSYFSDMDNQALTSADGNPWWYLINFTQVLHKAKTRKAACNIWNRYPMHSMKELKDRNLIRYVKVGGTPTELFEIGGKGFTPVMTILGLQAMVNRLPDNQFAADYRDLADKTLALWIAGDKTHIDSAIANAASSAPIQQLYRKDIAQQRASAGTSIAAPPEQVLERACLLLLHLR